MNENMKLKGTTEDGSGARPDDNATLPFARVEDGQSEARDWREMPAGRELDWYIAQRLGWACDGDHDKISKQIYLPLYDSNGGLEGTAVFSRTTGELVSLSILPHYSTDLNAAWELLPIDRHVRIVRTTDRGGAAIGIPNEVCVEIWNCVPTPPIQEAIAFAETPALAVVYAVLAWKEMQP